MTVTLTDDHLRYITLAESVTKAHIKDCIDGDDKLVFIVEPGQLGQAIGRRGDNIRRLKDLVKKRVEIVEYADDEKAFIRNVFHQVEVKNISIRTRGDTRIANVDVDMSDKGRAIGKGGRHLRLATKVVSRHFDIDRIYIH